MKTAIQLCPKETAVLIRKILKQAFPLTKFSVVTERGSMVSSVRIKWTDGPTIKEVESRTGCFESGRFNGMTDSYDYDSGADRFLMVDDVVYKTGCKYVSTSRSISAPLANELIKMIAEFWGGVEMVPVAVEGYDGFSIGDDSWKAVRSDLDSHHNSWCSSIHRASENPEEFTRSE